MVTPKKGFSGERDFGEKSLDVVKYFGKNFWKVLPVGSWINYKRNLVKKDPVEKYRKAKQELSDNIEIFYGSFENKIQKFSEEQEKLIETLEKDTAEYSKFSNAFKREAKKFLHEAYSILGLSAVTIYTVAILGTHSLNPVHQYKHYRGDIERAILEVKEENKRIEKIDSSYNSLNLFQDAKNFEDSLEIYKKFGLPIRLETPNLEQKEKIVKQNSLEEKTLGKEILIDAE